MSDVATDSTVEQPQKRSNFRWAVLAIVCVFQMINFADRANIGVVIPSLRTEFGISNAEAGALASIFFLGYAFMQIPAGFLVSRFGTRGFVASTIFLFSGFTYMIGTATNVFQVKMYRLLLGITEAPTPVGASTTIKNWFPPKERGIATGFFTGTTAIGIMIAAPVAVWIMLQSGWRSVFFWFAAPGIIMGFVWYAFVRRLPQESPHANAAEVAYISQGIGGLGVAPGKKKTEGSLGWLDAFIRLKKVAPIESNLKVFSSFNLLGVSMAYFFMQAINYGLLTWIPSYLIVAKHYSPTAMGFLSAAPWLGGFSAPSSAAPSRIKYCSAVASR